MKFLLLAVSLFSWGNAATAAAIYSDTFESGDSLNYGIVLGSPQVIGSAGLFSTSSLEFTAGPAGLAYDQIQYQMNFQRTGSFQIEFDLDMSRVNGQTSNDGFSVLFDTPSAYSYNFASRNKDYWGNDIYDFSQILTIDILVDLDNRYSSLIVNDKLIYQSAISDVRYFSTIRFNHRADSGDSIVLVDNIVISSIAPIPAPGAVWLFASALTLLGARRRRSVQ